MLARANQARRAGAFIGAANLYQGAICLLEKA
jgi:hypothetical protein